VNADVFCRRMDLISLIKSNTRVRFDERSESGFSPCGRDRPKGDSEVAADEESAPNGEPKTFNR
jgi:hypothetical protein